ncbi:MAG: enoyl-CoA hydratase-related protein [Burkholderiaceae bacterium]|nr:enoyl-CoA hydratase-related protein [Burkholderiaceae bacterium]
MPALRYFLCGGAPIPGDLVRRALAQGLRVLPVYGTTESLPHAMVPPRCRSGGLAVLRGVGGLKIVGRVKELVIRGGQNISVREVEDALAAHPAVHEVAVVGVVHDRLGETLAAVVVPAPGRTASLAELRDFLVARGISRFKLPEQLVLSSSLPRTPSGKFQKVLLRQQLTDETLQVERRDAVDWLTLNRPDRFDALNRPMIDEPLHYFDALLFYRAVRVVVLQGAGRHFCASMELPEADSFADSNPSSLCALRRVAEIILRMRRCPQPIIGLFQGAASGAGPAFALARDVRFAAEGTHMNVAMSKVGLTGCDIGE